MLSVRSLLPRLQPRLRLRLHLLHHLRSRRSIWIWLRGHNVCPRSRLTRSAAKSFWLLFTRVGGHPRVLVDLICRLGLYQGRAQDRLRLRFGLRLGFAFIVLKLLCLHGPRGAGRCRRILWLFMQQVSTATATGTPPHSHSLRTRRSSCASLAQNTNVDGLDSTITLSRQQQFHLMRGEQGQNPAPFASYTPSPPSPSRT